MTGADALPHPSDDAESLLGAAGRCSRLAAVASRAAADLAGDGGLLRGSWQGPAAAACGTELRSVVRLVRSLADPLQRSAGHLRAHAEVVRSATAEVDALRREYDDLVAVHRAQLSRLAHDTAIPGQLRRFELEDTAAVQQAELARVLRRHHAVLERVDENAKRTAARLSDAVSAVVPGSRSGGKPVTDDEERLAGMLPLLAAWRSAAGVGGPPPPPGTPPGRVQTWWAALSSDERERVTQRYAARIGALAGLPASVRTAANEQRLAADLAMLRAKAALRDDERAWLRTCELVQQQLDRVRADEDPVTLAPMTAQLLVFEPTAYDGEGRAAVAVGDVDTAQNVAFLVPGLNATVQNTVSPLTSGALRVTGEARRLAPDETTATVAWVGYDAPGVWNVAGDDAAEAGADLLVSDVLAVQAARDVSPHLTVVGHSYGSTTTGVAVRDHDSGVDDVVLVGSPGPDVESVRELRLPAGHVFVGASSRDPVSYLDRFGKDPTHASFGAVRFEAEDPTRNSWRLDVDDHSKYFNPGTESLANIAHVVTGDYEGVVTAPYRREVPLLPDGIASDPETDRAPHPVP